MTVILDELVRLLALERLDVADSFRGQSQDLGWGTVYGGQVLGQALSAAVQSVPTERQPHSLHAYFLRPGAVDAPIVYAVDRIRDGGTFTTRRVVASQNGQPIFNLAASFQIPEAGFEHHDPMPDAPDPDTVPTQAQVSWLDKLPPGIREKAMAPGPFDLRIVEQSNDPFAPSPMPPQRRVWVKADGALPDDPALHRYLLAYASDYAFLTTALLPHGVSWLSPGMQVASLDHVMWFHQPFRVDEWLLHVMESPEAHGSRGLVRGRVFARDGRLVASTAQEGLIRRRSKPKRS